MAARAMWALGMAAALTAVTGWAQAQDQQAQPQSQDERTQQDLEQSILLQMAQLRELQALRQQLQQQQRLQGTGGVGGSGVKAPDRAGRVEQDPGLFQSNPRDIFPFNTDTENEPSF